VVLRRLRVQRRAYLALGEGNLRVVLWGRGVGDGGHWQTDGAAMMMVVVLVRVMVFVVLLRIAVMVVSQGASG
jgi:hypothetical protein